MKNIAALFVNTSGYNISVYSGTTGGISVNTTKIGTIVPNEFYIGYSSGNNGNFPRPCRFRNSSGIVTYGYIQPYTNYGGSIVEEAWASGQKEFHLYGSNGSSLTAKSTTTIDGSKYYVFTVKKAVSCIDANGNGKKTLPVGTQVALQSSTNGVTNYTYVCTYWESTPSGIWKRSHSTTDHSFVDTGLGTYSSMPSTRALY